MLKSKNCNIFAIILIYCLVAVTYVLATPPLEASDEYKHYPFVQYVQNNWELPVLDPEEPGLWLQEAAQPPLYYGLMALVTLPIDTSDLESIHQSNPHAFVGNPNQIDNKNIIIHQPEQESFPWSGTVLAVYLIRLASIGLGVGTILIAYRLSRLLFDEPVALLAATLTAFNPMFLFVSAAVNNDSLAIFLGHLGLFLLVRLWLDTPDPRKQFRPYLVLGIVLGLGLLTKLSLGGLLGLTGLALAIKAWQKKNWQTFLIGGPIVLASAFLVSAAWFWHNWQTYGDPTGLNVFMEVQDARLQPLAWSGWVAEFGTFYRSFWGLFGGVNVASPEFVYAFFNLIAIVGTAAFFIWLWRNRNSMNQKAVWLLLAWPLILFLLLLRWNTFTPGFQGRLIFPGLGALNLLWAVGLLSVARQIRLKQQLAFGLSAAVFLVAAFLPWTNIRPAYVRPQPLASVPETAAFGPFSFQVGGGEIRLVGVEFPAAQIVEPGGSEPVEVVLYWQSIKPVNEDYLSTVTLLGRDNESVGHVNRYPASGMIPTSQWQMGQIWRDVYNVYAIVTAEAPTRLRLRVTLYDVDKEMDIIPTGPNGTAVSLLVVGEARLAPTETSDIEAEQPLSVPLADSVTFLGYGMSPSFPTAGETLSIELYWQADSTPSKDYTVFVQLLDAAGDQLAGADGPPLNGDFPTSWWREGDQVVDTHLMQIPADITPGEYTISVGLYDPLTGQRPSRLDGQGDAISLPLTIGP